MSKILDIYFRKLFSLALIFNSLLTIVFAIGLLAGYYSLYPAWTPYPPYIIDGQLFWILIPAATINIIPCVNIGKVDTGRLWFHHYVYGFAVAVLSAIITIIWAPTAKLSLFTIYTTDFGVNLGRFLILGGLTLIIDDLPDVSRNLKAGLASLKSKAQQKAKILNKVQLIAGFIALYFLVAVGFYLPQHPAEITLANSILIGTLSVTVLISFANVKRKVWLRIGLEANNKHRQSP